MARTKSRRSKEMRELKCMNSNPETSKWGDWAPEGGCDEVVLVDEDVAKVLCWRCTSRSVNEPGSTR